MILSERYKSKLMGLINQPNLGPRGDKSVWDARYGPEVHRIGQWER